MLRSTAHVVFSVHDNRLVHSARPMETVVLEQRFPADQQVRHLSIEAEAVR